MWFTCTDFSKWEIGHHENDLAFYSSASITHVSAHVINWLVFHILLHEASLTSMLMFTQRHQQVSAEIRSFLCSLKTCFKKLLKMIIPLCEIVSLQQALTQNACWSSSVMAALLCLFIFCIFTQSLFSRCLPMQRNPFWHHHENFGFVLGWWLLGTCRFFRWSNLGKSCQSAN